MRCAQAQRYIQEGKRVVVDVDLEKFFDRVNHDVLMGRLEKRIGDKRMLGLIRRYLEAGIMANGVVMERYEGTPQGGPLSPLLANVLLDEVDKELEKRGLSFVRYADDLNVYVRSRRAGEDAMETLRRLYARLRLRINEAKSAVARAVGPEVPGLQLLGGTGTEGETARGAQGPGSDEAASPGADSPERWRSHEDGVRGTAQLPLRLEAVLPAGRHAADLQQPRRVAPPPAAHGAAQTVEARQPPSTGS